MFQLLHPIWLSALTALSAPVIIHLWNQRPRHTLRVGSIALAPESAISVKRSLKLSQVFLLLLRCLFLACAVVALAAPIWLSNPATTKKGWVLIPADGFAGTYRHFQPVIDSLLQAGFELHWFAEGFEQVSPVDAMKKTDSTEISLVSYRALLGALNGTVPDKLPLYIFSDNYLRHFGGPRNAVSMNLHWEVYTPATINEMETPDTSAVSITILSKKTTIDGRYLSSVLQAIGDYGGRALKLSMVNNANDIKAGSDWLFWLDQSEPEKAIEARRLVVFAGGKTIDRPSYILPADSTIFTPVRLYRRLAYSAAPAADAVVIWKDGFGDPLLTKRFSEGREKFEFYTRIDPAWNDLPLSDQFPQLITRLLFPQTPGDKLGGANDPTTISRSQIMPTLRPANRTEQNSSLSRRIELGSLFWLLAAVLFLVERLYSFYLHKRGDNA